jgi:hypothetical protein
LLVVFVPSRDREGATIDQDFWVDEVLTALGQLFRGATAYPRGRGVWRNDEQGGALVKEEPVIVFSYVAAEVMTAEPSMPRRKRNHEGSQGSESC